MQVSEMRAIEAALMAQVKAVDHEHADLGLLGVRLALELLIDIKRLADATEKLAAAME